MSLTAELKPCPRCGTRAEVVNADHIRCANIYNCDCETRLGIEAWNRRSLPSGETVEVPEVTPIYWSVHVAPEAAWVYAHRYDELRAYSQSQKERADRLQAENERLIDDAEIGKQWREDSSLEKWFPFTAQEIERLREDASAVCKMLEIGDNRLLASDGPCGNQLPDLSPKEWGKVYRVCKRIAARKDAK